MAKEKSQLNSDLHYSRMGQYIIYLKNVLLMQVNEWNVHYTF